MRSRTAQPTCICRPGGRRPKGIRATSRETLLAGPGFNVGGNVGGYANPELDALLAEGRQTFDEAERRATYARVQEIIAAEAALIPVFHASAVTVGRAGLNNFAVHPAETYWIDTQVSFSE